MVKEVGYLVQFEEEYDEGGYPRRRRCKVEYKNMDALINDFKDKGMQKAPSVVTDMRYTNGTLHANLIGKTKD